MFGSQKPYSIEELKVQIDVYKALTDYLENDVFVTHRDWDGKDFYLAVKNAIDEVKKYIVKRGLNTGWEGDQYTWLEKILEVYDYYPEVIQLGLMGKRSAAFRLFEEKIHPTLRFPFSTYRNLPGDPRFDRDNTLSGYRIRIGQDSYNANYSRPDLFHIPFELNHLIGNNRFSLSGFPCLYMSNSIYGAWEELNRPDIDKCFASKFNLQELSFVDISMTPSEITSRLNNHVKFLEKQTRPLPAELVESFEHHLVDYLYIWPVILCCSFKVKNNSVFKPEYIFPQLVLEWIVSDYPGEYDGIKFLSTKSLALEGHISVDAKSLAKNYVIPARQYQSKGFCSEYTRKIAFTQPVNYAFHTLFGSSTAKADSDEDKGYKSTVFGVIEELLDKEELKTLDEQN
ncbi:hypothetical protein AB5Q63_004678 [Vibrio parahaemolyticus]|uniref:hypothetical protein n=1 Tax=Vibrio parahaemolyticus TaxID=670 RepID=UPI001D769D07|nr:hypothetical protein [Vibrio parahaemolyticus]EGR0693846.1 hypothetical protein [Vibrio parahaemolyticus]EGV1833451.1 hypothetical protein [Vibrio parahaemolyticus]EHW0650981.1 hypothetical protein [Vibrio parahaemolyticus]MCG0031077.1 hypothetical protein [Vibrio parahaemolyticus]